jgi:PQQ-like domain
MMVCHRSLSRWLLGAVAILSAVATGMPRASSLAPASGQVGTARPVFVLRYDGPGEGPDYSTAVAAADEAGGLFVAGSTYGGPIRGDDYTTLAYSPGGTSRWLASYNGPDSNIDQALDLALAPGGGAVYVTGYSFGGPSTTNDATTIAYDGITGDRLWVARYDGPGHDTDVGAEVAVAPDGQTVFITGASVGADGMLDVLTVAYDTTTGSQKWVARLGESNAAPDEGLSIAISPDGGSVYVTGYRTESDANFLTVAYSASDGVELWKRSIDAGGDELGRSLVVAPDGSSVYATGYRSGAPGGLGVGRPPLACASDVPTVGDDYLTVAYDSATGQRRWIRNYDGPDHDCDEAYGMAIAPNGSAVFVTGSSFSFASDSDVATVAYSTVDGTELWASRFDGPSHLYDAGDSVSVAPDSSRVYVAGSSIGATTDYDFVTLFYDAASGDARRVERYDGLGHGFDAPNAIAIHPSGRFVYVTGGSTGLGGNPDYVTVAYEA